MKKLIIIIALFLSYDTYAQNVPKAGNRLNLKPYGLLVPISTTDDTHIARAELFDTGLSVLKASTLPTASASVLGVVRVGTGLAIDGSGILSATGGGGTSYTAGNGLSLTGTVFSADTSIVATNANTLSLAETFSRFGSGNFFTNSTYFVNGGTNNTTDVFSLNPTFIASKQDLLVSGTNIKTLGGVSLLGSGDFGILSSTYGGTGVNNGGRLLTYAGAVTFAGAFTNTITATANTTVTFPTTGTLYGTATGSITSAQLLASLSNETGTGTAVFSASPTFTGTPLSTTAAAGTNTTQIATTAFVQAGLNEQVLSKTAAYTILLADFGSSGMLTVYVNATSAAVTITLPSVANMLGKVVNVFKTDASANVVTVTGAANINGASTFTLPTQYNSVEIHSNNTQYYAK